MARESSAARAEFDRLAADYDQRWSRYLAATLGSALAAAHFDGTERVLDVPCGTGELERLLLARWPHLKITGVDISPGMLRAAAAKHRGHSVTWIEADVAELPLAEGQFDWALCANAFHFFPRPVESLAELRRVLRPGGTLVLLDWCDDYLITRLHSLWLRRTDPAFHRTYSLAECRAMLENAGFEVVDTTRFRLGLAWGLMRLTGRAVN